MSIIRRQIILKGILQGIGFRPTVYRLARKHELAGWVINTTEAVRIEIEGTLSRCEGFISELPGVTPPPGQIHTFEILEKAPIGETSFRIQTSLETQREITPIPPDVAACPECVSELFDPNDRRYLFPFVTCTLCGPRFTVVRSFPYDRERTSMADFEMCEDCATEYKDPDNRRFHSQTNSCPKCGPKLSLVDSNGKIVRQSDPIVECIKLLKQGQILAIKGLGGFHLAVDALNNDAVQRLRELKGRPEKPFAVMSRDIEEARKYCEISPIEAGILKSSAAPIVLLRASGEKLAPSVAPYVSTLGIMLPYAPVHHLLFRHPYFNDTGALSHLVMTSGNSSDEPIAADNDEALERLGSIADAILLHNRQIVLRADDSIVRIIRAESTVFRRSRGYVPLSFQFGAPFSLDSAGSDKSTSVDLVSIHLEKPPAVLGVGADLKNAPAILDGELLTPGPHVGDLESPEAQDYFAKSIEILKGYLNVDPSVIAYDPHPAYFSSKLAKQNDKFLVPVYHHHAHAVSLLLENSLSGPILCVVFDGTGYGDDGTIWGGEFLLSDRTGFKRLARLRPFPLIGSEAAIREPLRIAAGLLAMANGDSIPEDALRLFGEAASRTNLWLEAWKKRINAPLTSSAGRLFDAAAAIVGFRRPVSFEGQAAMWLESIADGTEDGSYSVGFQDKGILEPDVASLLSTMANDALAGTKPEKLAARFHNSVADVIVKTVEKLAVFNPSGIVGLTGGCFQNKKLTETVADRLERLGSRVLCHKMVPVNDGGIAVGQAVVGREIWLRSNVRFSCALKRR
jgi:hydrogenase maturation protein HypF